MLALDVIRRDNIECTSCSLREGEVIPVVGQGPTWARVMVVGDYPGETEDVLGRPFEDRAGLVLKKVMRMAGLPHESCWMCLAVRCLAERQSAERCVSTCKQWLWKEIQAVSPRVIVTLGLLPTKLLLRDNKTKLAAQVGRFHKVDYTDALIAPWHGQNVILQRGKAFERETIEFFERVRNEATS